MEWLNVPAPAPGRMWRSALAAVLAGACLCLPVSPALGQEPGDAAETQLSADEQAALIRSLLKRVEELERAQQQTTEPPQAASAAVPKADDGHDSDQLNAAAVTGRPAVRAGPLQPLFLNPLFAAGDPPLISEAAFVSRHATALYEADPPVPPAAPGSDSAVADMFADQDARLAALERQWQDLQRKQQTKTYPTITVNGVFQADAGWFHQDSASEAQFGQIQDGADFRRARLSAKGSVTEQTNYFFQMDFGFFGRPTFTDLWVEQTNVPLFGNVRIGQWKQPFSLEVVSSFRYTTFMERSQLFQAFTPFRHIGIGFYDWSDDLNHTWAASVFRSGQDQFGGSLSTDGGVGTAERATWLALWEDDGREYLHLGVGHFFNSPPRDTINFRTIPELYIGANANGAVGTSGQAVPGAADGTPFFIATGNLNVTEYNVVGSELLFVEGPFSLQSEVMVNMVNQAAGQPSAVLPGAYAQVGWFLTGEHRPYDRKAGAIDRVIPRHNLLHTNCRSGDGMGAWEVAGRWSYLDLNDETIAGGTMTDYTLGLNWYWNPYTKMVFNYIHSRPDSPILGDSTTDLFGVRAQVDF